MDEKNARLEFVLTVAPVVPVLTVSDPKTAVPLARALVAGGLPALEVTLRTAAALECLQAMADVEGAIPGAGTVLDARQYEAAAAAGAQFIVSPGATQDLLAAARASAVPFLPGVATATEAMRLADEDYRYLKFFPAEPAGGVAYLKALAPPLPMLRFCPTGGIGLKNARDYLALANVVCVGGSWVAPNAAIKEERWQEITMLAREASMLARAAGVTANT